MQFASGRYVEMMIMSEKVMRFEYDLETELNMKTGKLILTIVVSVVFLLLRLFCRSSFLWSCFFGREFPRGYARSQAGCSMRF